MPCKTTEQPDALTHGEHPREGAEFNTPERGTNHHIECEVPGFKCPLWPECDCPGGTTRPECPALNKEIEDDGFITVYPPTGGNR